MVESSYPDGGEDDWDEEDWGYGEEDEYLPEMTMLEKKQSSQMDGAFGVQKVFQAGHSKNQHYTIIDANEIHVVQE